MSYRSKPGVTFQSLTDSERLTRLESSVESIASSVKELAISVNELRSFEGDISQRLSQVGKWDIKTFLIMAGLVTAPIAGMWALAIAPINQNQIGITRQIEISNERVLNNTNNITQLSEKFIEVETQFGRVSDNRNMQYESLEGRVAELWQTQYGREMPRTTQYPHVGNGKNR